MTILELLKSLDKSFASKILILVLRIFTRKFNVSHRGYNIIFHFPRESFMYSVHRYNVAKLNRLHQIFWSIIIKVTGSKNFLDKYL